MFANTPPSGEAPKPRAETRSPVRPSGRVGIDTCSISGSERVRASLRCKRRVGTVHLRTRPTRVSMNL
eukprot:scaffold995_cov358-Pavlova_lutheri.AAC.8